MLPGFVVLKAQQLKADVQKWCAWGCRRVQGLDATAARTFFSLRSGLERLGVELVLTHMPSTRYAQCMHACMRVCACALPTKVPRNKMI